MARLTPSPMQAETLEHIRSFIAENGYSPTVAELAKLAGIRPFALQQRLDALERKALITRAERISRSVRPTT